MKTRIWAIPLALAGLALAAFAGMVLAENVDPNNDNSQFAWSENAGWLNAEPANCGNCGLQVGTTKLTGYVWGENIGWVNMHCSNNYGPACTGSPAGNWGVTRNSSTGALSGYAWAENAGWINMSCVNNGTCAGPAGNWGVTISPSTGIFSGNAWGENIGWISFSDTSPVAYSVRTFADRDADGPLDDADNCPAVANAAQANADGDAFGDACDACPATADPNSCPDDDNDGFTDVNEGGTPLCGANVNHDGNPVNDDTLVNDGCPAVGPAEANCADTVDEDSDGAFNDGCPQIGSFSEAQFKIGTGSQDPCGNNGWPLELVTTGLSANRYNISDIGSFVAPIRRLGKNPNQAGFSSRWDLVPGAIIGAPGLGWINVQDLATTTGGGTAFPRMLGGVKVLNQLCPYPP
jgi:hypothetical protein